MNKLSSRVRFFLRLRHDRLDLLDRKVSNVDYNDYCGKPKSFTMRQQFILVLPSAMKEIRRKAREVWLSRENKQSRAPFRTMSFLMSRCAGNKRLTEREGGREKEIKREEEHFGRVILKRIEESLHRLNAEPVFYDGAAFSSRATKSLRGLDSISIRVRR